jgi:hypothetical protein
VWKTGGFKEYQQLLGNYLPPGGWWVRFFRLDTDVAERAEEFHVLIYGSGQVFGMSHEFPEARALPSLDEASARKVAESEVRKTLALDPAKLKVLSSQAERLPARTDWSFVFLNPEIHLESGEARIRVQISGDTVSALRRFVFIPETWQREERNKQNGFGIARGISALITGLLVLAALGFCLSSWVKREISHGSFLPCFVIFLLLEGIGWINDFPVVFAHLSTESPLRNQIVGILASGALKLFFSSAVMALVTCQVQQILSKQPKLRGAEDYRVGYGVGMVGCFLLAGVAHFLPALEPVRGKLSALDGWISGIYLEDIGISYFAMTLFAVLLGSAVQRIKYPGMALFALGFVLSGFQIEDWVQWGVQGLCLGLILWQAFGLFARTTLNLIPAAVAGIFVLIQLRELRLNAYTGSFWITGVGVLAVLGGAWVFGRLGRFDIIDMPEFEESKAHAGAGHT